MDTVTGLIDRARESLRVASARLVAARRAEWTGVSAESYRLSLADCAARLAALEREAEGLAHAARTVPTLPSQHAPSAGTGSGW